MLITGSTRGLGYELARSFLKRGDAVFVTSRDGDKVREVVEATSSGARRRARRGRGGGRAQSGERRGDGGGVLRGVRRRGRVGE